MTDMRKRGFALVVASIAVAGLTLSACTTPPGPAGNLSPLPSPPSATPAPNATPVPSPSPDTSPRQPVGTPVTVATGLAAPWSIAVLGSGSALVSERDSARVMEVTAAGELREAGVVAGVVPGGEGGLLGLALRNAPRIDGSPGSTWLYAYFTAADDNRIVRLPLIGGPGAYSLGSPETILEGIAKAKNHNGGRLAFGPDGMLYATVGDAGQPSRSQDPASLNGKILRLSPDGGVPADNPTPGSPVYSLGHRNPQGIAWGPDGTMWASEFGQNTWDELNIIAAGQNYGWPTVEGAGSVDGFVNPVQQWSTREASPSGIAAIAGTVFTASLRGQRMWATTAFAGGPEAVPYFVATYGRLRDAVAGPNGTLWMLTNNTDGRGSPGAGDDRIIEVRLAPVSEG